MGRKIFISYQHNSSVEYQKKLMKILGNEGHIHKGEDFQVNDWGHVNTDTLMTYIHDDIKDTSLTIVLLHPQTKYSNWVPWELSASMKRQNYRNTTSNRNGVIGILIPINNSYDWAFTLQECGKRSYNKTDALPGIVRRNRFNTKRKGKTKSDDGSITYDRNLGSFIQIATWDEFVEDKDLLIDNATVKSQTADAEFNLDLQLKTRDRSPR